MYEFYDFIFALMVLVVGSTLSYLAFDLMEFFFYDTSDIQKVEVMNIWDLNMKN